MSNQPPAWSPRPETPIGTGAAKVPPRARDPETGAEVPDLTLWQRVTLGAISGVGRPLITKWAPRQVLKLVTYAGVYVGATQADTSGAAGFLVAALGAGLEFLTSWLSRRYLKLKA
jgi:hypothetical protein